MAASKTTRRAAVVWPIALALVAGCAAGEPPTALPLTSIGDGAYVFIGVQEDASASNLGAIANVGFVIGDRCVAIIDTGGSPMDGARLRAAVRAATEKPICAVINTHMHPDHVYGNSAFVTDHPQFIGHANLAPALAARSATYARSLQREL
ncbi:MAG TPA: MBL fold metallo-hydrolase, partial [Burkholderiaceae bacterium]